MEATPNPGLTWESEPSSADIRFLEERIYEFNVQATGISDGELFGVFLRAADGAVIGGADGWTWGGTCYIRHLVVPAPMRKQGHGARLMARIEEGAKARQCEQIVLETHDFQAPDFYRKLGFTLTGSVDGYPRGHRHLTFVKHIGAHKPLEGKQRGG
jgi:N-acetylglutamate synthase-like GNAT family acetyltransferase